MITNIDNITVIVNASGPSSWNGINVAGESLWVKQRNVCAKCQCEVESSGVKECPHCNAKVITSMQKYLNASDVPQEYETYSARKKPASIEKSQKTNIFKVIEHSQYRFDILKASVEVTGEYIFEKYIYVYIYIYICINISKSGDFLEVQWLYICLQMQGHRFSPCLGN